MTSIAPHRSPPHHALDDRSEATAVSCSLRIDAEGRVQSACDHFETVVGSSADGLIGQPFESLSGATALVPAPATQVPETPMSRHMWLELADPKHSSPPFPTTVIPDSGGGWVAVVHSPKSHFDTDPLWSALFSTPALGIAVLDENHQIIEFNQRFLELANFVKAHGVLRESSDIAGRNFFELFRDPAIQAVGDTLRAGKTPARGSRLSATVEHRDQTLEVAVIPVLPPGQARAHACVTLRDLSAEAEFERCAHTLALERCEKAQLLHAVDEGVWTMDCAGTVVGDHSPGLAKLLGEDQIAGRNGLDLLLATSTSSDAQRRDVERHYKICWSADGLLWDANEAQLVRKLSRRRHDELRQLEVAWLPIRDASMILRKVMVVIRDCTPNLQLALENRTSTRELELIREMIHSASDQAETLLEDLDHALENPTAAGESGQWSRLYACARALEWQCMAQGLDLQLRDQFERDDLRALWLEYDQIWRKYRRGRPSPESPGAIDRASLERIASHCHDPKQSAERRLELVRAALDQACAQPLSDVVRRFGQRLKQSSQRRRVPVPELVTDIAGSPRLTPARTRALDVALAHIADNVIDHAYPKTSASASKGRSRRVEFQAESRAGQLLLRIADDGPGLNMNHLAESTPDVGGPLGDQKLAQSIFEAGRSTLESTTPDAKVGIGLSAAREAVSCAGGTMVVRLDSPSPGEHRSHRRFALEISFDDS